MSEPFVITSQDPVLKTLHFKPFLNSEARGVKQFLPDPGEPQTIEVKTPWGAELLVTYGDYIVSDLKKPSDRWPVDKKIFEETYLMIEPERCMKNAETDLVPMIDLTNGNPDQLVTVETLEGPETVRAGDFYLARGIKGEIWPYPANRMTGTLIMPKSDIQNNLKNTDR
jgi:hypothetical protein